VRFVLLAFVLPLVASAEGLDGQINIHDPSTVLRCNGRFYTYGTGGGSLVVFHDLA
jgi:arabinan endo-1,5-alpha-L-arabinosidase